MPRRGRIYKVMVSEGVGILLWISRPRRRRPASPLQPEATEPTPPELRTGARDGLTVAADRLPAEDRKSTRLNSSHVRISYAVFCLKKKKSMLSTTLNKKNKQTVLHQ